MHKIQQLPVSVVYVPRSVANFGYDLVTNNVGLAATLKMEDVHYNTE